MCHDLFDWFDMSVRPTAIFCDNKGAIQNAKHPNFSDKLRHAANKIFYIREVIATGRAFVRWLPGTINPADLGTKALPGRTFQMYTTFIMNMELPTRIYTAKYSKLLTSIKKTLSELYSQR